jgi:acetyl esterase
MKSQNKVEIYSRFSTEMKAVLDIQLADAAQRQSEPKDDGYPAIRRRYEDERRFWNQGGPQMQQTLDVEVPFNEGTIAARLYYPPDIRSTTTLFYLHGGGFCVGSINTHDRIMRILAAESGCVVIGVDYTLSPEAKYPQAIEETIAVLRYFNQHAEYYSLDAGNICLAGDSAGAHLAFAVYLWLRDKTAEAGAIKALLLYYGLYGLKDSRSIRLYGNEWDGLTESDLQFYRDVYLNDKTQEESPYYCFFNNDLTVDMPDCFIAACEFDPLLDDSEALYAILKQHNPRCEYKMYPGVMHAFLHYSKMMDISRQAIADGADFVRRLNR